MPVSPRILLTESLRRGIAAGSSALVLALTMLAASPAAHAWLHDRGGGCPDHAGPAGERAGSNEAGCAIALFASGVDLPVAPVAPAPPHLLMRGPPPATAAEVFLVSPRYLRQPERGPPGRA